MKVVRYCQNSISNCADIVPSLNSIEVNVVSGPIWKSHDSFSLQVHISSYAHGIMKVLSSNATNYLLWFYTENCAIFLSFFVFTLLVYSHVMIFCCLFLGFISVYHVQNPTGVSAWCSVGVQGVVSQTIDFLWCKCLMIKDNIDNCYNNKFLCKRPNKKTVWNFVI